MAQFSDEWLESVKGASDILDIVGAKVDLRQTGKNYTGLCPFHDEKTPSFSVNPDKQFFYCFGCGAGGNVFNFLMRTEGLTFPEAAEALAEKSGIEVPHRSAEDTRRQEQRDTLYRLNHKAAEFFYRALRAEKGKQARQYLTSRGIGRDLARHFFLGYAPDSWDALTNHLSSEGFSEELLLQAGLALRGQRGLYDRFRQRIIFPICDHQGRFLGFGGRSVGQGSPKYLNSPESPVFRKAQALYGLNWSKEAIKERNTAVLVEGYTDCISLAAKGISNVTASLGTAFTADHARLLQRFASRTILAFDGDAAGQKAAVRSMHLLRQNGLDVLVAPLEPGVDPDTLARQSDPASLQLWLEKALPWPEYLLMQIMQRHDLQTREGKLNATQEIVEVLATLSQAVERAEYIQFASERLGVDPKALRSDVEQRLSAEASAAAPAASAGPARSARSRVSSALTSPVRTETSGSGDSVERDILRRILHDPRRIEELRSEGILPRHFKNQDYRHLYALLLDGSWDLQGEKTADAIFQLEVSQGRWREYIQHMQATIFSRELAKIEENLGAMEKNKEDNAVRETLFEMVYSYFSIRKKVFHLVRRIKDEGPLGRGESK